MKEEIVIVNQDSGYLMIDIANAFTDKGYSVTLITGRLVVRSNPLSEPIRLRKIIEYKRQTGLHKIFTWLTGFFQILLLIKFKHRSSSLLIVSNPPFAPLLPMFVMNKFSLLIFDIYPDSVSEVGIMKADSFLLNTWRKANKRVYSRAERIFTITEGLRNVLQKYTGDKSIEVIDLWSDNGFLKPVSPETNPFVIEHGLLGKFIVLYSGNIGSTQNIEALIEVARDLKRANIVFVIIGNGAHRDAIKKLINNYQLKNCLLLPWQEPEKIPFSFAAANLAVVSLGNLSASVAIPSKFYDFLSVGAPILGLAMPYLELGQMIDKYQVGRCFKPDDKDQIINYIYHLADNPEYILSIKRNALSASRHFTSANAKKFLP